MEQLTQPGIIEEQENASSEDGLEKSSKIKIEKLASTMQKSYDDKVYKFERKKQMTINLATKDSMESDYLKSNSQNITSRQNSSCAEIAENQEMIHFENVEKHIQELVFKNKFNSVISGQELSRALQARYVNFIVTPEMNLNDVKKFLD